jgi:hypothetical protein
MPDPYPAQPAQPQEPDEPAVHAAFDDFASRAMLLAPAADLPGVRSRAGRSQTTRWIIAAAAAAAIVIPVGVYAVVSGSLWWKPATTLPAAQAPNPASPSQSPAPSPSAGPSAVATSTAPPVAPTSAVPATTGATALAGTAPPSVITDVDWPNATIDVPANQSGCAAGTAHFLAGAAEVGGTHYLLGNGMAPVQSVAYGDVNADGRQEALLIMSCTTVAHRNPPGLILLLSYDTVLHTMAVAFTSAPRTDGEGRSQIRTPWVAVDGSVHFEIRTFEGNGQCEYVQEWTGSALSGTCG